MKMTISIAQMAVACSKPGKNLEKAERFIARAKRRSSDLVCFPEMWTTGLNWRADRAVAGKQAGTIERVSALARSNSIWIGGSMLAVDENGKAANTFILFDPQGREAAIYRKIHLFSPAHEDDYLAPGDSLRIADTPWGPVGLAICYDIRFPEVFRSYALKGAKLVLLSAAFPSERIYHWKTLIRARAIEDQLFMVGVNQVGSSYFGDEGKVRYSGSSAIIDPWGKVLAEGGRTKEELLTATIDLDKVDLIRDKTNVLGDRRPDLYDLG